MRACLAEEFTSVHVVNLRGNARTSGELRRTEGDNAFGQGSRSPVGVTILVRNPKAGHKGCCIRYRDIGDYLKREEKLAILREAGSVDGIADWKEIRPDRHHDWIGQRDAGFQKLYPVASKAAKAGQTDAAVFRLYSNGYKTGRDAYVYSFSRATCAYNAKRMVRNYEDALRDLEDGNSGERGVDDLVLKHSAHLRWDREQKRRLRNGVAACFSSEHVRMVAYRPFVEQFLYADYAFSQAPGKTREIFPSDGRENRAICVPGVGSTKPFSALVVDRMPDLELMSKGQCLPRYRFVRRTDGGLFDETGGLERVDNITGTALREFQAKYGDGAITRDSIFDYVYGVLHSPVYRDRFANDLAKDLPRIPLTADFEAFAEAGERLAELHLGYETGEEYPLEILFEGPGEPRPEHYRIGNRAMRFADGEKTILVVNDHIRLGSIPPEAHGYQVNGRTPLEWLMDRYRITQDKESGIVNDPNEWFDDPKDLIRAICRIVRMSVETLGIVKGLPDPFERDLADGERQSLEFQVGKSAAQP